MDYKNTLNLPQTDFPMQGKLPSREPLWLELWQRLDLYQKLLTTRAQAPSFLLHDGPPYANGHIHIGHAVNKILKDIINKSRLLEGMRVPFVPGWDCHGLPIEIQVEKSQGRPGIELSPRAFREACRVYAAQQIEGQKADFIRLGILGDWQRPYQTMDFAAEADIIRELGKLVVNGQVYRGAKPVHWCVDCGSALAEAEVEYRDRNDPAIDVGFLVNDTHDLAQRLGVDPAACAQAEVVIWTTTPWTLPANQAVALHPEYDYVLLATPHRRLILAAELCPSALTRYGEPAHQILVTVPGRILAGLSLRHPFEDRQVPVVLGEHVTLEAGTGCVHTAPAHGVEDYQVAAPYHLSTDTPVLGSGRYRDDLGNGLGGISVQAANDAIPALLQERGRLIHQEMIHHSYPHCWRHKTPLLFRATPQWFISMERNDLRAHALEAIGQTRWIPNWGEERITDMVRKRPDWCISRQRSWGVPVALFACSQCGEPLREATVFERIAKIVAAEGVDAWFERPDGDFLGENPWHCPACGHGHFEKVTDILDVWFDSGTTHAFVLERRAELHSPADLYLEGADQHRGWFQSSLLESVATRNRAPYRAVLTHGFTVDGQGRKMSKSVGNVIAPQEIIDRFGADILRLWVASEDYRGEIPISDAILQRLSESYRRIRNTARYILGNTFDFAPQSDAVPVAQLLEMDRWLLTRLRQVQDEIRGAYEGFQFHRVVQAIHHFCSVDLGGFYLDVLKDRLYTTPASSLPRRSAQTVLTQTLHCLLAWMAPILSFTAEEIWQHLPWRDQESVFFLQYPELPPADSKLDERWQRLLQVREAVNGELERLRQDKKIGSALDACITIQANDSWLELLQPMAQELRFLFLCSDLSLEGLITAVGEEQLPGLLIVVTASVANKCSRCWHRRQDVGQNEQHPSLCSRCIENLSGPGERREFC